MSMNGKMKFILISLIACIMLSFVGCGKTSKTVEEDTYVKFQDRMSMDWDVNQERLLMSKSLEMTGYYKGTPEEYAYNILVTLNRMLSPDYPNTIEELCPVDEWNIPDDVKEGMRMVVEDRWDETYGSTEYKPHQD